MKFIFTLESDYVEMQTQLSLLKKMGGLSNYRLSYEG